MITQELRDKVLDLKDLDKIHLIEILFDSLDQPSPEIEQKWARESEARYQAYKAGEANAVSLNEIKEKYKS